MTDVPVNCPADAFTGPRQALEYIGADVPEVAQQPLPGVPPSGRSASDVAPAPVGLDLAAGTVRCHAWPRGDIAMGRDR